MSRLALPVAVGLAIALAGAVVVGGLSAAASRTPAERADALAAELRCPDCQGLSVADSPTNAAAEIRRQIDELITGGATDDEIRAHFTARYGEWIRLAPSAPAVWIIPLAAVVIGAVALAVWLRAGARRAGPRAERLTEDERQRLHGEAEALDG